MKKYGQKVSQKQVDSIIRRSEYANQVEKVTRKLLRSLIVNYENNGHDAERAVQLEFIK